MADDAPTDDDETPALPEPADESPTPEVAAEAAQVLDAMVNEIEATAPEAEGDDPAPSDDNENDDEGAAAHAAWQKRLAEAHISPQAHEALADARTHLDAAWHRSDIGTESPAEGRLRHARRAALKGLEPVTSHQVPFNREIVVAVDRLTRVVEELSTRLEVIDEIEVNTETTLDRVGAEVATGAVQLDDLAGEVADLTVTVAGVVARLDSLEALAADLRQVVGATRAREDLVLRALRDADQAGSTAPTAGDRSRQSTDLGTLADAADAGLLRRIGSAGRPRPEVIGAWAHTVADVVAEAGQGGPVIDLDPDHGEWLDVWVSLGLTTAGIEADEILATALRDRGHDVAHADPVVHLRAAPAGSLGAVTAAVLADVRPLGQVVDLVDAARSALRPGGALVLAAAHPAGRLTDDVLWADPRRRALHPDALSLLALERGFVEAEVLLLDAAGARLADPVDGIDAVAYLLVARVPGGAPSGS